MCKKVLNRISKPAKLREAALFFCQIPPCSHFPHAFILNFNNLPHDLDPFCSLKLFRSNRALPVTRQVKRLFTNSSHWCDRSWGFGCKYWNVTILFVHLNHLGCRASLFTHVRSNPCSRFFLNYWVLPLWERKKINTRFTCFCQWPVWLITTWKHPEDYCPLHGGRLVHLLRSISHKHQEIDTASIHTHHKIGAKQYGLHDAARTFLALFWPGPVSHSMLIWNLPSYVLQQCRIIPELVLLGLALVPVLVPGEHYKFDNKHQVYIVLCRELAIILVCLFKIGENT